MKIATIRAPIYLPWLPFMWQLANSDVYVVLDNTQFNRRETCAARNYIKLNDSKFCLSVPVKNTRIRGKRQQFLDAIIDNTHNWAKKHFKTICHAYSKAPFFKEYKEQLEHIYDKYGTGEQRLVELDLELLNFLIREFGINVKILKQSELGANPGLKGAELMVDICKKIDADTYLCGGKEETFLEEKILNDNNIKVIYRDSYFKHPVYNQQGKRFIKGLSSIDLLFNHGAEGSQNFLLSYKNNSEKLNRILLD